MKRLVVGLVLTAGLVFGAEEAAKEEHKGGVPEVSVLWKWANFAILFGVLGYLAAKQVGPLLQQRSREITEGLAAGESAQAEAAEKAKAVNARLASLGVTISVLQAQAYDARERETERIQREAKSELERIQRQAELEIESFGKQARKEVRQYGAKLALDLAEKKVRARMNTETQTALVNNFVKKVADGAFQPSAN